jgi:hypothetical protein
MVCTPSSARLAILRQSVQLFPLDRTEDVLQLPGLRSPINRRKKAKIRNISENKTRSHPRNCFLNIVYKEAVTHTGCVSFRLTSAQVAKVVLHLAEAIVRWDVSNARLGVNLSCRPIIQRSLSVSMFSR